MLCALQKSDTGTLKLTKQPKLSYKDQTKYGRYTTFSLSVPFLLSLRFLMLGDAMWLDIGVMPSGPSKICWSDRALPEDLGHECDWAFPILCNQILLAA